jgi:hypothetical protein
VKRILQPTLKLFEELKWAKNYWRKNVSPDGPCFSMNFGIVKHHSKGYVDGANNTKYPEIFAELKRISTLLNIECNAYTINKNLQCEMHYDHANCGESTIVALGDYTGGRLVMEVEDEMDPETVDIRYNPITFDGSEVMHGTEYFTGNRYSIVFYTLKKKTK